MSAMCFCLLIFSSLRLLLIAVLLITLIFSLMRGNFTIGFLGRAYFIIYIIISKLTKNILVLHNYNLHKDKLKNLFITLFLCKIEYSLLGGQDHRYYCMTNNTLEAEQYFANTFEQELKALGNQLFGKYAPIVHSYNTLIIPFEKSRMQAHQSIVFENSSLEQNKMELLNKIQQLKAEKEKSEEALDQQQKKVISLATKVDELESLNIDNASVIESLRLRNDDYKEAINHKNGVIAQLQKQKQILLQKYQAKDAEYQIVLANCIRDKGLLAQRLNHLNELEQSLLQKEKEMKAQQFYLKKQWEEFEENSRKTKETPKPKQKQKTSSGSKEPIVSKELIEQNSYNKPTKKEEKDINNEILRNPLRKLVKHHQSQIYDMSFNYNGNLLATCGGDRFIKIYDLASSRITQAISTNSAQNLFISMALDYGGERLLTGSTDKTVSIYHSQSGKHMHSFLGHGDKVNSVTWTNYKQKCASGSDDKQLKIWDIEKASNILSVGCQKSLKVLRSNNVEPVVYSGHADGSVRVYSISQGNSPISQIKGVIDYSITSLTLLSNRHQILATSMQGSVVHLLDLKMNKSIAKFEHQKFYNSAGHATMSPSESHVLAGNCDGSIYYWNRFKGDFIRKVTGHDVPVTALHYHFMSSVLATADKQGSLILWQ